MEKGNLPVLVPVEPCLAPDGPRLRRLLPDPQGHVAAQTCPLPRHPVLHPHPGEGSLSLHMCVKSPPTQENGPQLL